MISRPSYYIDLIDVAYCYCCGYFGGLVFCVCVCVCCCFLGVMLPMTMLKIDHFIYIGFKNSNHI